MVVFQSFPKMWKTRARSIFYIVCLYMKIGYSQELFHEYTISTIYTYTQLYNDWYFFQIYNSYYDGINWHNEVKYLSHCRWTSHE